MYVLVSATNEDIGTPIVFENEIKASIALNKIYEEYKEEDDVSIEWGNDHSLEIKSKSGLISRYEIFEVEVK